MNEKQLIELWHANQSKPEMNADLYKHLITDITRVKAQNLLTSTAPQKLFALAIGLIWVITGLGLLIPIYLHGLSDANLFFLVSASIQISLTAFAVLLYLYQLITMNKIDISMPVLQAQRELACLRKSSLWIARFLILQLPVWSTFYWNESMLQDWSLWQWGIQLSITAMLTFAAIWFFVHIRYSNRHRAWFKFIFQGSEWTRLVQSIELLEQIEDYTVPMEDDEYRD